jgi:hypothetical protein
LVLSAEIELRSLFVISTILSASSSQNPIPKCEEKNEHREKEKKFDYLNVYQ